MAVILLFYLISSVLSEYTNNIPASCDSEIYCQGDLLHYVQLSKLYHDSKTFVDKSLRFDPKKVTEKFNQLKTKYSNGELPKDILMSFVESNFLDTELLEPWTPLDWTPKPSIVKKISDPKYQKWALDLNEIWKNLGRKMKQTIAVDPQKHSLIYVPNGFIVPGGRFNELYYWDTYWIINGLLLCDMYKTAQGVIENMLYLVRKIGHVPNGSRVYYMQRTQPPMLTLMVDSYFQATGDFTFIKKNIEILDKEMDYWNSARMAHVTVNGKTYQMYRYHAVSTGPRPESYKEDYYLAANLTEDEKTSLYIELKSGAESGWDFSSRWFKTEDNRNSTLRNIRTSTIIPVDLNSILEKCFRLLSSWHNTLGNEIKSKQYIDLANQLQTAIQNVLWDDKDGIWYDYDLKFNKKRKDFYMSNFAPLWTKSYQFPEFYISNKIRNYIINKALTRFVGGTPTSLQPSAEQWDFPNAWPPLQAFLIQGLENIGTIESSVTAFQLAKTWLSTNYKGFKQYKKMFEKYDSLSIGKSGSGGEYEGQNGFGWTNGVVLEFLNKWGFELQT